MRDAAAAHGLRYAALKYFNVAGADPEGRTGQASKTSTHLIKVACEAVHGKRPCLEVFGDDYDTPDGTCIRDYLHVWDLAMAHCLCLDYLIGGGESTVLNCGYGQGHSVLEVVRAAENAAAVTLSYSMGPRRPGDISILVADNARIREVLGWKPQYADLDEIVGSALQWERRVDQMLALKPA